MYERLFLLGHVAAPLQSAQLPTARISSLDLEVSGEEIGEFGSVAVSATCHLLLVVMIVRRGEEVSEDEFGNIDSVLLVNLDGYGLSIVGDRHLFTLDLDFDSTHLLVSLVVVCCVYQDLIKDLIEARDISDVFLYHGLVLHYPQGLLCFLDRADVDLGPH